jgi:uncharacterized protein YqgV (UPF0045/DUF77 family)
VTTISAQVSLYPLRRRSIGPAITRALEVFRQRDLEVHSGAMSTILVGQETEVFEALRDAFHGASDDGEAVMIVTVSNACPVGTAPAG